MAAAGRLLVDQTRMGGARGCPANAANRLSVPRSAGGAMVLKRRGENAACVVSGGNMPAAACTVGQQGQSSCWHGGRLPPSRESRSRVQRTAAFASSKFARASPEPVAAVVKTAECETAADARCAGSSNSATQARRTRRQRATRVQPFAAFRDKTRYRGGWKRPARTCCTFGTALTMMLSRLQAFPIASQGRLAKPCGRSPGSAGEAAIV